MKGSPLPEGPSAQKALNWLRSHLGTGENPPGSNRNFITEWGRIGNVAWCDICFWASECVAWDCYDSRRLPDDYPIATDYSWGDAYVPSTRHHFRLASRYSKVPTIGAACIFTWNGADEISTLVAEPWVQARHLPEVDLSPPGPPELTRGPRPPTETTFEDIGDHIGRVEAWVDHSGYWRTDECAVPEWDRTVICLEGNADNALVRKRRPMTLIDGFGHMSYPVEEEEDMAKSLGVYDWNGRTWLTDGLFTRQTNDPFVYLNAGMALHLGTFSDGQHGELIERGNISSGDRDRETRP